MNCESNSLLKILTLESFRTVQSALNDPKLNSNNWAWKLTYKCRRPWVHNFHPVHSHSTISPFPDNQHFRTFQLNSMLKFWRAIIFLNLGNCQESNSLYNTIVTNVLIKSGWDRMKSVGVAFWNFQPHMVLCYEKFQSVVKSDMRCKTLHIQFMGVQVQNFHLFCPTISHFEDIQHFRIFFTDSHFKMSKWHNIFKTWPIAK